jgi:hypothetical protein
MTQDHTYTAHIAGNKHTWEFDTAKGETLETAVAALKRKNSPDWKDCCIWVTTDEYGVTDECGYRETACIAI